MYPLQNYAEQMGGFDFSFTQRYINHQYFKKLITSIKKCHQTIIL